MAKAIVTDIRKCLACQSCEMACALVHSKSKVLEESIHETPRPQAVLTLEVSGQFTVPIQCRHCQDAPCITVCPTSAIHRDGSDDPVLVNRERCIGCGCCITACPFGVIDVTRDGKAVAKCDLCIQRTKAGQPPACVESCPTGAMRYAELSDVAAECRHMAAEHEARGVSSEGVSVTDKKGEHGDT